MAAWVGCSTAAPRGARAGGAGEVVAGQGLAAGPDGVQGVALGPGAAGAGRSPSTPRHGRPGTGSARRHSSRSPPAPTPAGPGPGCRPAGAAGHGWPGRLAPGGWPGPRHWGPAGPRVAVAVGVDPEGRRRPGLEHGHGGCSVQTATVGGHRSGWVSPCGGRTVRGHARGRTGFSIRPATMVARPVPAARGQISRKAHPRGGQRGLGSLSLPAPRPASTQTRHHSQHHS
jgi:hypothetical protein